MSEQADTATGDYEEENRVDELHDLLIESFAAGYAKAVDDHDVDVEAEDVAEIGYVKGCGYYHWEGRYTDLEHWIRQQFDEGDGGDGIEDFYPRDCVLCGHTSETHTDHEQHIKEAHK